MENKADWADARSFPNRLAARTIPTSSPLRTCQVWTVESSADFATRLAASKTRNSRLGRLIAARIRLK